MTPLLVSGLVKSPHVTVSFLMDSVPQEGSILAWGFYVPILSPDIYPLSWS